MIDSFLSLRKIMKNVFLKLTVKMLFNFITSSTITRVVLDFVVETLLSAVKKKVKNLAALHTGGGEPAFQCKEERDIPFGKQAQKSERRKFAQNANSLLPVVYKTLP